MWSSTSAVWTFIYYAPWRLAFTFWAPSAPQIIGSALYWLGFSLGVLVWVGPLIMMITVFISTVFVWGRDRNRADDDTLAMVGIIAYMPTNFAVFALILAVLIDVGRYAYDAILATIGSWWAFPIGLVCAWLLYGLRCNAMPVYALLEVGTGIATIGVSSTQPSPSALAVLSGVYIVIRGASNLDDVLAKTAPPTRWRIVRRMYVQWLVLWSRWITLRYAFRPRAEVIRAVVERNRLSNDALP